MKLNNNWKTKFISSFSALGILILFNQCVGQYEEIQEVQFEATVNDTDNSSQTNSFHDEGDIVPEEEAETGATEVARTAASVGVLNFEQIDASFQSITGVDRRLFSDVNNAYIDNFLGLPGNNSVKEYNASHTMAVFKVASAYCARMKNQTDLSNNFYGGFINLNLSPNQVLANAAQKSSFIDGMIDKIWGVDVGDPSVIEQTKQEMLVLLDELLEGESPTSSATTRRVATGVCAAMLSAPQIIYL